MPYASSGTLTTDKQIIGDTGGWDTQAEWEAYQSKVDVDIVNGSLELGPTAPASAIDQFHAEKAFTSSDDGTAITSWAGEKGNVTLTGGSPVVDLNGLNGFACVNFDGTDDMLSSTITTVSQPTTIFIVRRTDGTTEEAVFDGGSTYHLIEDRPTSSDAQAFAGASMVYVPTYSAAIYTVVFDGANSLVRENGSQIASGDVGANALDGITLGARHGGSNYGNVSIGVVEPHDVRLTSSEIQNREQSLAGDYGITLS